MRLVVVSALACAFAAAASAQQPTPSFAAPNLTPKGVQAMAANCAICHGTHGRPAPGSSVPRLAARPPSLIVAAMREFREGKREATVMQQIAKGYADAEVEAMAAYFSSLAPEAR